MASRPLILVSCSIEKEGVEFGDLSASLSLKYDSSILQSGGIPVTAPTTTSRSVLAETVRRVEGVLLTGGDDINPDLYDSGLPARIRRTVDQTPDGGARDLRELILIEEVFRQGKPLLAICRGHQLLNIAFGGQLIADIRRQLPQAINHQQLARADELVHEAALTPGSLLAKICGRRKLAVNSSHHQAVQIPAEPFVATAVSADGLVEAMELKPETVEGMPFFLSVQFHPERLAEKHAAHRAIFNQFVAACARHAKAIS